EISNRLARERVKSIALTTPQSAYPIFSSLAQESQEVVACAFLDVRSQLIRQEIIFRGSLEGAVARPREILKAALRANAAGIIVAHNHPSQETSPSEQDVTFTVNLEWACEAVGILLLDHLIIAGG